MTKKLLVFSLLINPLVLLIPCTSCNQNGSITPQPEVDVSFSAEKENTFGFSNKHFTETGYVSYPIQISGDIQDGDILELDPVNQKSGGEYIPNIQFTYDTQRIKINSLTKEFIVTAVALHDVTDTYFECHFDISIKMLRNKQIVYKTSLNDFVFVNATPTFDELFETMQEDKTCIKCWNNESWAEYQRELCDFFWIPQDIKSIAEKAFYNADTEESLLPQNMKVMNLNSSLDRSSTSPTLLEIGASAFQNSDITSITLPNTLQYLHTNSFSSCKYLKVIDLSSFESIPTSWDSDVFYDVKTPVGIPKGVVYVHDESLVDGWKTYFADNETNSDISDWTFTVYHN